MTHTRPRWWPPDEDALVAEAAAELPGEHVLAAGIFSLEAMIKVAAAGGAAGGLAGSALGEVAGAGAVGGIGGNVAGMHAAKKSYAAANGQTVQLVVAITNDSIHVLNRDPSAKLPTEVSSFNRANCEIEIKHLGPSRLLHLTDAETGQHIELGGTLLSQPDRLVIKLLAGG